MANGKFPEFRSDLFELDSNFFLDFAMKRGSRRFVALFDSTTGKSNLSRPRVAFPFRSLYQ